ncbi:MAG: type II toxin-antitoxin system HigA family antitoxin [Desulfococcaceae bacterium]
MTDFSLLKAKAVDFFSEAPFLSQIRNENDYERAMELMDELVEDYETYRPLIELLSASIEKWENESEGFSEFNRRIQDQDDAVAVLTTLLDQHEMQTEELGEILGERRDVSLFLRGERVMTRDHIQRLTDHFGIPASLFFRNT